MVPKAWRFFSVVGAGLLALGAACGSSKGMVLSSSSSDAGDDSGGTCYGCSSSGPSDGAIVFGPSSSSGGFMAGGTLINNHTAVCTGTKTTISGRVYDPAMQNPVYNITVYNPAYSKTDLTPGVACSCSSLYPQVFATTLTDANGYFKLDATPDGTNVPLVIQSGKWRMWYTLPKVTPCVDNPVPDKTLHLPRNHNEGDIPQIAISTGAADSLECLLKRMGLDDSEYVAGPGTATGGHLHIFTGAGGVGGAALQGGSAYDPGQALWNSDANTTPYDVVLFSCEGGETAHITSAGQQVILNYANGGGRIFASHFHYALFNSGPFATTPKAPVATWTTGANIDNDPINGVLQTTITAGTLAGKPFAEGVALKTWLGNVGALTNGALPIHYGRDNAVVTMSNTPSQLWISADNTSLKPGNAQYFSFDTPFTAGGDKGCSGRVVYSDLHVSGGPNNPSDPNTDYPGFSPGIVPSGCTPHALTPQEKALEFMILDLSSCLIPVGGMPFVPPLM
jgi:hypothetical protein